MTTLNITKIWLQKILQPGGQYAQLWTAESWQCKEALPSTNKYYHIKSFMLKISGFKRTVCLQLCLKHCFGLIHILVSGNIFYIFLALFTSM